MKPSANAYEMQSGQNYTTTLKHAAASRKNSEKLLSKQELAAELGVSLVTLTDWMKKGLPYLRLHKRVYFKKSEVLNAMQQTIKD